MVNAKHARPLAAFSMLAAAAAVITGLGLADDHAATQARHGSPIRVPSSATPELVLGGLLRAQPSPALTTPLTPDVRVPLATPIAAGGAVQISEPSAPSTAPKARTKSGGGHQATTAAAHASHTATATVSTSPGRGHAKGRKKSDAGAKTTATATVTSTASSPRPGHGHGRPDNPGKGSDKGSGKGR